MADTYFKTRAEELGLTQRAVADQFGMTSAAAGYWFRGENPPPVELADELARIFQTDRQRILEAIHAIAVRRAQERGAAARVGAD